MNARPLIDLAAPPFCGHLHPILGMARRLAREYEVRILSTELGLTRARAAGFDGVALLPGGDEAVARIVGGARATRSNPLALHAQLRANLGLMGHIRDETIALYHRRKPALLIADLTLPVLGPVAQSFRVPWWTSHPSPCVAEPWQGGGVPAYLGGWSPRPGGLGTWRDRLGNRLTRLFKRTVHASHRRQFAALGFPQVYRPDGTEAVYSPENVLGLAWPELEFPRRWPPAFHLVGPVLFTPPGAVPELEFAAGRRHVLVTFGTHSGWLKDRAAQAVRRAADALPEVTFHFSDGEPEGNAKGTASSNFRRVAYVPYDDYLPRYDLVVHHAGAGVMYACLRHGKPAVVFPVDFDQFDQAARLTHAGLARRLHRLPDLANAVRDALADDDLRDRCAAFQACAAASEPPEERIAALVRSRLGCPREGHD